MLGGFDAKASLRAPNNGIRFCWEMHIHVHQVKKSTECGGSRQGSVHGLHTTRLHAFP